MYLLLLAYQDNEINPYPTNNILLISIKVI